MPSLRCLPYFPPSRVQKITFILLFDKIYVSHLQKTNIKNLKKLRILNEVNKPGRCHNLVNGRKPLGEFFTRNAYAGARISCYLVLFIEALSACSQVENLKQKTSLDRGKDANTFKEERNDPFTYIKQTESHKCFFYKQSA